MLRSHLQQTALIFAFCALLLAPLTGQIAGIGSSGEEVEKREWAARPSWPSNFDELSAFPRAVDAFLSDRFGFREIFIRLGSRIYHAVGVSISPRVLMGENGWLFYADENDGDPISGFRGLDLYSPRELDAWFSFVDAQRQWLAARGIPFILVAVPNKHTVYPEFIPSWVNRAAARTRFDQLAEHTSEHPEFDFIDLRKRLIPAKENYQLYYRTGTHWNKIGALLGYLETMSIVQKYFPDIRVLNAADFAFGSEETGGSDLAQMLYLEDVLEDVDFKFHLKAENVDVGNAPHLLLIGDSFSGYWTEFFATGFGKVTYVLRGGYGELPRPWIEENKPDLVIFQIAERYL